MVQRKEEKTAVLVLSIVIIALALLPLSVGSIALARHAAWYLRLAYPIAHGGVLHAIVNCWCLVSIVFVYDVSWKRLIAAYAVAVTVPNFIIGSTPVVGASGVCFALIGMVYWQVRRKMFYSSWAAAALAIGFCFPQCAAMIHLWCCAMGVFIGFVTTPSRMLLNRCGKKKGGHHGKG